MQNRYKQYIYISINTLVLSMVLGLTACGGGGEDPPPPGGGNPPPTGQGNLSNGGTVTGVDGVAVHALNNTLGAPIDVTISTAATPGEALPVNAVVVGDYYELRANENIGLLATSPLVVSFPVPDGTDTTQLALAVRISSDNVLDAGRTGWEWQLLSGRYDPDKNTFLTTLLSLTDTGRVFSLVTHPDFNSPVTVDTGETNPSANITTNNIVGLGDDVVMQSFDFDVRCLDIPTSLCTDELKNGLANLIDDIRFELLLEMVFPEPRLQIEMVDIGLSSGELIGLGYVVYIAFPGSDHCKDSSGKPVNGIYFPGTGKLIICAQPDINGNFPASKNGTVVHEYFHATQYAYPDFHQDSLSGQGEKFLIEGTAAAAVNSYVIDTTVDKPLERDTDYNLRRVDIPLKANSRDPSGIYKDKLYEYEAQDFWVYAGLRIGKDLEYLHDIFNQGSDMLSIQTGFAILSGLSPMEYFTFESLYWDWVKDHTFEHSLPITDTTLDPCQVNPRVINSVRSDNSDNPDPTDYGAYWRWFPVNAPSNFPSQSVGFLEPLQAVTIRLEDVDGFPYELIIENIMEDPDATEPGIVFKVYSEFDTACANVIPDGMRITNTYDFQVPMYLYGNPKHLYVLAANLSSEDINEFVLRGRGVTN